MSFVWVFLLLLLLALGSLIGWLVFYAFRNRRRHNKILEMLRAIDRDILATTGLDERLQVVAWGLLSVFDAALACVWLLEEGELVLRARAGIGACPDCDFGRISLEAEFPLTCVVRRGPYLTDNIVHDDFHACHSDWARREGLVAFAGYPLVARGQPIGVLALFSRHAISDEDFTLLDDCSAQVAVSVHSAQLFEAAQDRARRLEMVAAENAQLYQESRRRAGELAALIEIDREISTTLDLPRVLALIASWARDILHADDSELYLLEPDGETLRVAVALGQYADEIKARPLRVGEGVVGKVVAAGMAEMVNRVDLDPRSVNIPGTPHDPESLLCAPLFSKGEVIGALVLSRVGEREFVQADLNFLISLAQQAAIAIENARLMESERAARVRADTLRQVAQVVGSTLEINEVLRRILAQLKRVLTYDTASVLLYTKDRLSLVAVADYTDKELVCQEAYERLDSSPILAQMAQDHQTILIDDVREDDRWIWVPGAEHVRAWIGVPIVARDEMIGALMVDSAQPGFYNREDADLVRSLAQHTAIAIENARFFEQAQRQVAEFSTLFDLGQALTSTLDREELLGLVAAKIGQAIDATSAYVCDIDREAGTTTVLAEYLGPEAADAERVSDLGMSYPLWNLPSTLEAVRDNEPLVYYRDEIPPDNLGRAHLEAYGGNSVLLVPFQVHGETLGYVELWDSRQERIFTPAEIRLCQTMTHQAALAFKNVQLYQDVQERAGTLAALHEMGVDIASELEADRLLVKIVRRAIELLRRDSGSLWLHDPGANLLRCVVSLADWRDFTGSTFRPGEGLNGQVFEKGAPVLVDDYQVWAEAAEKYVTDPIGPAVGVPLIWKGQVRGVLNIAGRPGDPPFSRAEAATLNLFAAQAVIAIENARLFDELQQHADELAAANARLQELDRIKDEFIQNVSHELRTPLALIRGYAEALESGMLGEFKADQGQPISIIARRARMMTDLVEDITALLEVEAQAIPRAPLSLSEMAREAVEDFQTLAGRNQVTLRAEITPDLPPLVGQGRHLRKVLDNLINNALKFTPAGGTVTVRLVQEGAQLVFSVSDTGIGIPHDKQPRVFERFYQVDGSRRRRYGGSGLGLALVQEITQAHGGRVELESEPERGSTFTVILPVSHSPETPMVSSQCLAPVTE